VLLLQFFPVTNLNYSSGLIDFLQLAPTNIQTWTSLKCKFLKTIEKVTRLVFFSYSVFNAGY